MTTTRTIDPPAVETPPTSTGLARRELTVFAAVAAGLAIAATAGATALGADLGDLEHSPPAAQTLLFAQAFVPVTAAAIARRATGQRLRGAPWGWRRPDRSWLLRAWFAPLVYGGVAAVAVWGLGLGGLDASGSTWAQAVVGVTVGIVPFVLLALGEELAWRGTVAARAAEITTPFRAALGVGVAWSLFHWPLMLIVPGAIEGAPTWWGVTCFSVSVTAIAFPMHRLWQRTGSVWVAAVFHAAHNAVIYFVADPLTTERSSTAWFAGETGLVLVVTSVTVSAVLWRRWAPPLPRDVGTARREVARPGWAELPPIADITET